VAPFNEEQTVSSTGTLSLQSGLEKMVVIGSGIIGLEMGIVWSRLGTEVTVAEFLNSIGGVGIDEKISWVSFIVRFSVLLPIDDSESNCKKVDQARSQVQAEYEGPLGSIRVCGRIVIDDQFNTSVLNIQCIGDITFGPMLAHKAEEESITAAGCIRSGHGHVNYRVGKTEQESKKEGVRYKVGRFSFLAKSQAKANSYTEGQVKSRSRTTPSACISSVRRQILLFCVLVVTSSSLFLFMLS
jgi:dihydrolipoamide dehydrogenase